MQNENIKITQMPVSSVEKAEKVRLEIIEELREEGKTEEDIKEIVIAFGL